MVIVHRAFGKAYDESARLVRAAPSPSPARVMFLAGHIDFAVAMLDVHHEGEDELLYPELIGRVRDQAPMTEEVEHEHRLIKAALDAAAALGQLNVVTRRHLDDEEQEVVPLAAVTLTRQEWDALGKHGVAQIPRNKRDVAFGMILDPLGEDDRGYMMRVLPAPVRMLSSFLIGRPWNRYASTLRAGT